MIDTAVLLIGRMETKPSMLLSQRMICPVFPVSVRGPGEVPGHTEDDPVIIPLLPGTMICNCLVVLQVQASEVIVYV